MREKIERGRYFTLNAGRQTGKTTLFYEMIEEIEATGDYVGIRLDFEMFTKLTYAQFYEELETELIEWCTLDWPSAPNLKICKMRWDLLAG